jgi:uncharacterized protein (TIGR03437 family)
VWEITDSALASLETVDFGIVVAYGAGAPTAGQARNLASFAPILADLESPVVPRFVALGSATPAFTIQNCTGCVIRNLIPGQATYNSGGTVAAQFDVDVAGGCSWQATTSEPTWLRLLQGSGTGPGPVGYEVLPNYTNAQRQGTITVGDLTFTVTQLAGLKVSNRFIIDTDIPVPGPPVAPGEIVLINGSALLGLPINTFSGATPDGHVPTVLGGTRVLFDGIPAPVFGTASGEVEAQAPYSIGSRESVQVAVEQNGTILGAATVEVVSAAPAYGVAAFDAAPGDVVSLVLNGVGETSPAGQDGLILAADATRPVPTQPVVITIDGQPVSVFSVQGASYFTPGGSSHPAGISQVRLTIPPDLDSNTLHQLRTTVGGVAAPLLTFPLIRAPGCDYSITRMDTSVPAAGGSGSFYVTTSPACFWTTTAESAWITIDSPATQSYASTVSFTSAANLEGVTRTGYITLTSVPQPGDASPARSMRVPIQQPAPSADIQTTVTTSGGRADRGGLVTFSITVRNNGPDGAAPSLTLALPTHLSLVSVSVAAGGDGIIRVPVPANASYLVDVIARVSASAPLHSMLTFAATLQLPNDPQPANNAAAVTIEVGKITPTITWPTPPQITYGTVLSATQLNATANTAGAFVYNPPTGTKLNAGTHTLSVSFSPTNTADYNTTTKTVTLQVARAGQSIEFAPIGDRWHGDSVIGLGATASSGLPVSFHVVSGPATLSGNLLTITGAGTIVVRASQGGNNNYQPAEDVEQSFVGRGYRVTIASSPAGLPVTVDGVQQRTPAVFVWPEASTHTVSAPATFGYAPGNIGYRFVEWAPAATREHTITVGTTDATYTATYIVQYAVAATVAPAASGSVAFTPASPSGFYDAGSSIRVDATPAAGYHFVGYSGGLAGTKRSATVSITQPAYITATFAEGPALEAVVNAAGFHNCPLVGGALFSAFGSSLAEREGSGAMLHVSSAGVDHPATLLYVSPGQLNFLMPEGVAPGPATLVFTDAAGRSATYAAEVADVAPGLFTSAESGLAAGGVVQVESSGAIIVTLYGTGFRHCGSTAAVQTTVGGVGVEVLYAGPQQEYPGLDQLNLRLPAALAGSGEVEVLLTVNGKTSNAVKLRL